MILAYPGLFVSLVTVYRVRKLVIGKRLKIYWTIVGFMNVFFIVTFAAYIFLLSKGQGISGDPLVNMLISMMLLMGGSWVAFLTKVVGLSAAESIQTELSKNRQTQLQTINQDLEKQVESKTKELEQKAVELQGMINLMSGRDQKLAELNTTLNNLKQKHA